ncbi:MAG: hypothetical protein IKH37_00140 [Prevotella sp.]|nr:hypothetical protein [Prevotella sp.]
MRRILFVFVSALSFLVLASCSSGMGELAPSNFDVNPSPLETQGGEVVATIHGKFPPKYLKKKAVVSVIPELHYGNGQVARSEGATFMGEKVLGNDQRINYQFGGIYTIKSKFKYVPEMLKSELFMAFDARIGKRKVKIPAVKVANGVIATSELYKQTMLNGGACLAPDSFQRVTAQKQEAQVKFLINQANLRKSELQTNSVKEFVELLKKINREHERLALKDVEIQAYASPEGGLLLNDDLANRRQFSAEDYVNAQLFAEGMSANVVGGYTAEDWEGFEKLVQASNIQDKDVILRVLSMYEDPYEREEQIRNMSQGFRELADGILPELRRSRMVINYEVVGRSDQQIKDQYKADPSKLSVEELLYAAGLESDIDAKQAIYRKTAELYPDDQRAANNVAVMEFAKGNYDAAGRLFQDLAGKKNSVPEAYANLGLIALKDGNIEDAEYLIAKATGAKQIAEALGNLNIAKGNYAEAAENLKNSFNNSSALAELLNKNYTTASVILRNVERKDAMTDYLQAIVNARQGNFDISESFLRSAFQKDPSLKSYAEKDMELIRVKK